MKSEVVGVEEEESESESPPDEGRTPTSSGRGSHHVGEGNRSRRRFLTRGKRGWLHSCRHAHVVARHVQLPDASGNAGARKARRAYTRNPLSRVVAGGRKPNVHVDSSGVMKREITHVPCSLTALHSRIPLPRPLPLPPPRPPLRRRSDRGLLRVVLLLGHKRRVVEVLNVGDGLIDCRRVRRRVKVRVDRTAVSRPGRGRREARRRTQGEQERGVVVSM